MSRHPANSLDLFSESEASGGSDNFYFFHPCHLAPSCQPVLSLTARTRTILSLHPCPGSGDLQTHPSTAPNYTALTSRHMYPWRQLSPLSTLWVFNMPSFGCYATGGLQHAVCFQHTATSSKYPYFHVFIQAALIFIGKYCIIYSIAVTDRPYGN